MAQLGNAPRINGDVRRPWNMTENISLAKTISMTDGLRLDVRMEAFNMFNRVIWGAPNTDFNNANFGLITSHGEFTAADAVRVEAVLVGTGSELQAL